MADITGTFNDCATGLDEFLAPYAAPVARRAAHLPDATAFTDAYLEGLVERFEWIQGEYRGRRRSFDTLFGHRPRSGAVAFADRWQAVLARMDAADPRALAGLIRSLVGGSPTAPTAHAAHAAHAARRPGCQMSKYSMNSQGCGRRSRASTSFFIL